MERDPRLAGVVKQEALAVTREIAAVTAERVLADWYEMYPEAKAGMKKLLTGECDRNGKPDATALRDYVERVAGKVPQPVHMTGGVPAITLVFAIPRHARPAGAAKDEES